VAQHLSEQVIERYRQRELSPAELLALDDHLAECASCRAEACNDEQSPAVYAQAISALQGESAGEDSHLEYQQLADYADNAVSDVERELADSHLEFCQSCRAELQDLQAIKAALAACPAPSYAPGKPPSLWRRLAAWWQWPAIRIPVQVGAAIMLVGLVVWLVMLYVRRPAQEARTQTGLPGRQEATIANNAPVAPPAAETTNPTPQPDEQNNVRPAAELLDSGHHITLSSDDKLSGLESASMQIQNEVAAALKNGRVKAPSFIADLKGQTGRLMGAGSSEYGLLNPVATAVESRTPTFHWRAIAGADSYVVTIYNLDAQKVAASAPLTETKWTANVRLERGRTYIWQVRASKQGAEVLMPPPAAPEARFRIIEAAKAEALAQVRHSQARSHLVLGLTYADAGLLDESERELRKLVAANPKSSVAKSLLRSVQAQKASR